MEDSQEGNVTGIDEHTNYSFRNMPAEEFYSDLQDLVEKNQQTLAPHELIGLLEAVKQEIILELHEIFE